MYFIHLNKADVSCWGLPSVHIKTRWHLCLNLIHRGRFEQLNAATGLLHRIKARNTIISTKTTVSWSRQPQMYGWNCLLLSSCWQLLQQHAARYREKSESYLWIHELPREAWLLLQQLFFSPDLVTCHQGNQVNKGEACLSILSFITTGREKSVCGSRTADFLKQHYSFSHLKWLQNHRHLPARTHLHICAGGQSYVILYQASQEHCISGRGAILSLESKLL